MIPTMHQVLHTQCDDTHGTELLVEENEGVD